MFRIRSLSLMYIPVVALCSLAVAACGSGGSTTADVSKAQTQPVGGVYASSNTVKRSVSIGMGVHVTNTPTKAFRVKPVDTTESVAVGPTGYPVYTFQGETSRHIICHKTASAKTNCWAFWPPVAVSSSDGLTKPSGIGGKLGTVKNHGVLQLTLAGQPLYYFTPDLTSKNTTRATGDEIKTFGSIWHIVATTAAPTYRRARPDGAQELVG
jgi:predicted lipoprotein with Yx(FWY)xxD motif